MFRMCRDTW
jgi:hypothetical protein